jgi:hypothetical protein
MWYMAHRGHAVVMTIHDQMVQEAWKRAGALTRCAVRGLFCHPRVWWVAVSENVKERLIGLGAEGARIQVIPAYLPPPEADANASLPGYITEFMRLHTPMLSAYGWRLWLDSQGNDIYGFDLCIELMRLLKPKFPQVGLVFCMPQIGLADYYAELRRRIAEYGLDDNILFITEPLDEAYPIWQASDVYLRPTTTDGDAVAVREAMSLGVPVVASDAGPRPNGAVVFPSRNLPAFLSSVEEVVSHKDKHRQMLSKIRMDDNFEPLAALYRSVV